MPRRQHKFHFIYKTVNQLNGEYYIGMHSTSNLEDGYIGSGKKLWLSIHKYGKENFKFFILEFLPDRNSLIAREILLVNEELLQDSMCMNLKHGGEGGFTNDEHAKKFYSAGGTATRRLLNKRHKEKLKTDESYRAQFCESMRKCQGGEKNGFFGKHHTEETLQKFRAHCNSTGEKNSQYGTRWITNFKLKLNKKIKKTDEIPNGWTLGRKKYK